MSKKQMNLLEYGDVITDTQREVYETHVKPTRAKKETIVLGHIKAYRQGLTNQDLCLLMRTTPNCISPNLTRLAERQKIRDSGQRRPNPNTGKNQIVWVIA